jgi:hypothetical protein
VEGPCEGLGEGGSSRLVERRAQFCKELPELGLRLGKGGLGRLSGEGKYRWVVGQASQTPLGDGVGIVGAMPARGPAAGVVHMTTVGHIRDRMLSGCVCYVDTGAVAAIIR